MSQGEHLQLLCVAPLCKPALLLHLSLALSQFTPCTQSSMTRRCVSACVSLLGALHVAS